MRHFPFGSANDGDPPFELTGGMPPPRDLSDPYGRRAAEPEPDDDFDDDDAAAPRRRIAWGRWIMRALGALVILFVLLVGWLAITAPLSKSLQPPLPPSVTLLAEDGTPIARRGAIIGAPVDAAKLPKNVTNAFIAIEDRRFRTHWGIDPRGILRAMLHNIGRGGLREGGSTITQQLAKNAFLDSDRTAARKIREVMIAFWLEAWLSKDQILSRYLSNVYFGDNVYGLRAAAKHYFNRDPEDLSIGQAAMMAGLVKAPSRLAPTGNLKGARARQKLVVRAMADAGLIDKATAANVAPARLSASRIKPLPDGTYFADWVLPDARDRAGEIVTETTVRTTLDRRLQRMAERAVAHAGLKTAQVALVAMRPDGRVVAMVGGKNYAASPFNRATQARRQPGSAFKLFVYLAAMRAGLTPDSTIADEPVTIGDWSPKNSDGRYEGEITLRHAFAKSSNVAAARLIQKVGVAQVIKAARDLGISTPIPNEATIALGTSTVSLLELTAAYAGIAAESYPVRPHGLEAEPEEHHWYDGLAGGTHALTRTERDEMLDLLSASAETGTGRRAALSIKTFGKTGTTQDNRDALFMGFADNLVVGVWVGNDDNTPNPGLSGGGVPARVWREFMTEALGVGAAIPPEAIPASVDPDALDDGDNSVLPVGGDIDGMGLHLHVGRDGSISLGGEDRDDRGRPPRSDEPRDEERYRDDQ
ncbi:penicillin-binding protein [Sphingomonas panacis]|uniref:Penicillin-binding protein n=1 Tax=Sphingomonas panacis TaxID=1560345 RepID=A0A1B3Z752_9SPHN|nr:transglycosylase domain-containing protein [Sphingomonas panacis]AOH83247.1 penicillin-binding protein [Sphingomonas panacis]